MFNTNIITVDEAKATAGYKWNKCKNDGDHFYGNIPGFIPGFCVEYIKIGTSALDPENFNYGSMTCTYDFDKIMVPEVDESWNDLGLGVEMARWNGYEPTGRIVFRGYYTEHYDMYEREEYVKDATEEVEKLIKGGFIH